MARFVFYGICPDGARRSLCYDSSASTLTWSDGAPVVDAQPQTFQDASVLSLNQPGKKSNIRVLKISLGLSCNYSCSYCSQRFVPQAEHANPERVEPFLEQLNTSLLQAPRRIEFWGGEPFVYWKTLKPLAEALRARYPQAKFSIITNGSLLDAEKNAWLDRLGFAVGLSHDGPGYAARGVDPLDDESKRAAIMDLWQRLKPQGRISVNAMIHQGNPSRAAIQAWLQERFGDDVPIGEGTFIDPYDAGGLASVFTQQDEHWLYRRQAFEELRQGKASNFHVAHQKIQDFAQSLRTARPSSSLGQKCSMDRTDHIAVDLYGRVLTCQNTSAAAIAPNGQAHHIGNLSALHEVQMKTSTHWSQREQCPKCPVLQLCKGGCMFLEGPLWQAGCDAAYSDNLPFLAAAIEYLTGMALLWIEGDLPLERKDVFGLMTAQPRPAKKSVIPIYPTKGDRSL